MRRDAIVTGRDLAGHRLRRSSAEERCFTCIADGWDLRREGQPLWRPSPASFAHYQFNNVVAGYDTKETSGFPVGHGHHG